MEEGWGEGNACVGEPLGLGVAQELQKDYQLLQLPHQFPAQCHSLLVLLKVQKGQTQMLVQKLVYWKLHHYTLGAQPRAANGRRA